MGCYNFLLITKNQLQYIIDDIYWPPRDLLQCDHVHGGQQRGHHHPHPQLPPQGGWHPWDAGVGEVDVPEMDPVDVEDVTTRHGSVAQVNHDGEEAEGGGGEGQGVQDIPDHQCALHGRRFYSKVSAFFWFSTF